MSIVPKEGGTFFVFDKLKVTLQEFDNYEPFTFDDYVKRTVFPFFACTRSQSPIQSSVVRTLYGLRARTIVRTSITLSECENIRINHVNRMNDLSDLRLQRFLEQCICECELNRVVQHFSFVTQKQEEPLVFTGRELLLPNCVRWSVADKECAPPFPMFCGFSKTSLKYVHSVVQCVQLGDTQLQLRMSVMWHERDRITMCVQVADSTRVDDSIKNALKQLICSWYYLIKSI